MLSFFFPCPRSILRYSSRNGFIADVELPWAGDDDCGSPVESTHNSGVFAGPSPLLPDLRQTIIKPTNNFK